MPTAFPLDFTHARLQNASAPKFPTPAEHSATTHDLRRRCLFPSVRTGQAGPASGTEAEAGVGRKTSQTDQGKTQQHHTIRDAAKTPRPPPNRRFCVHAWMVSPAGCRVSILSGVRSSVSLRTGQQNRRLVHVPAKGWSSERGRREEKNIPAARSLGIDLSLTQCLSGDIWRTTCDPEFLKVPERADWGGGTGSLGGEPAQASGRAIGARRKVSGPWISDPVLVWCPAQQMGSAFWEFFWYSVSLFFLLPVPASGSFAFCVTEWRCDDADVMTNAIRWLSRGFFSFGSLDFCAVSLLTCFFLLLSRLIFILFSAFISQNHL